MMRVVIWIVPMPYLYTDAIGTTACRVTIARWG
jgi:hypothetical protein